MGGMNGLASAFLEVGGLKKGRLNPIPGKMGHGNTGKQLFGSGDPKVNNRDTIARMNKTKQQPAPAQNTATSNRLGDA